MPFEIVRNDIANMQVDAIVNAASRLPRVNAGVDGAIHKKAGPSLLEARKKIGYIQPGTAAITPAFDLSAEYVIHAAAPVHNNPNGPAIGITINTPIRQNIIPTTNPAFDCVFPGLTLIFFDIIASCFILLNELRISQLP